MCGIAGIIGLNRDVQIDPEIGVVMTDALQHRGPDGSGYLLSSAQPRANWERNTEQNDQRLFLERHYPTPFFFGHRRLSIIDLSNQASQPMEDADHQHWIVFNGEIFNHREIRLELEGLGFHFKTDHSDTEVILNAYKAWGFQCLERFRGMFAFVLYDIRMDRFWVVRDRMGIKPLFFSQQKDCFLFASEIKSLLRFPGLRREMDGQALSDFLSLQSVPAPRTFFKGIHKLQPGHYLIIERGKISEPHLYWNPLKVPKTSEDASAARENLRTLFSESVDLRREADVPYGSLLSGGLDSSITLATLSKLIDQPPKTFTVGFPESEQYTNEFAYAREMAAMFQSEHHEIMLGPDDFESFFDELAWLMDEPMADSANIPIYHIARLAKSKGVTILMGGEGSDEILIGYVLWKHHHNFLRLAGRKKRIWRIKVLDYLVNLPLVKKRRPFYALWSKRLLNNQPSFWGGTDNWEEEEKQKQFQESFKEKHGIASTFQSIKPIHQRFIASGRTSALDFMTFLDLTVRLPELLLARLDRMTMAASVEGRVPFLDHHLVEFAFSLNNKLKLKSGIEKAILKQAYEGQLPKHIIYRKKDGFTIPLKQVFSGKLFNKAKDIIFEFNQIEKVFTESYLEQIFAQKAYQQILFLYGIARWWECYIKPESLNFPEAMVYNFKRKKAEPTLK
jgi:asparagine synthase (glutamine-hydrolysing)